MYFRQGLRYFFVMKNFIPITLSLLFGLAGCSKSAEPIAVKETAAISTDRSNIAARINGREVSLAEIDGPVKLALYDLEWQKYQLRRESLKRFAELSGGDMEVFLKPPAPPRLQIDLGERPIRGDRDAPVLLSVFCSFQSSHCARLQPVLDQLREDNGTELALAYFDFPQGFHRYGMDAANAVRCGFEDGPNWDYLDSMFGIYDDLNLTRFKSLARQTGVTPNQFTSCYNERKFENDILDDINYAQSLAFKNVPVVLVNGLYVKGPKTVEAYQFHIDEELARLGINKAVLDNTPNQDEGDDMVDDAEDFVPQGLGYDRVRDVANLPLRDKSQVTLSRVWMNEQLSDEAGLTGYFYKGDHKPGGNHVLKLSDVSGHSFFETMGFRTGDVILQVNGEWIHENQNSLWNDLRYSDDIEVKLMRRGKPVTYYYRFRD